MTRARRSVDGKAVQLVAGGGSEPILLLYVRAAGDPPCELDLGLQTIRKRYGRRVRLRTVRPDRLARRFAPHAGCTPAILVLRRGELVGEASGGGLPVRELDAVVRCALDWPAASA